MRALREVAPLLVEHRVQIWVRRAGPNYQEGLKNIKNLANELGLNMHVYGPDMHVSGIVPLALVPGKTTDVAEFIG
jgi:ATP citrate (pro-S)-lyase